jgi:hypothetical protein
MSDIPDIVKRHDVAIDHLVRIRDQYRQELDDLRRRANSTDDSIIFLLLMTLFFAVWWAWK